MGEPIVEEGLLESGIKNLFTPVDSTKRTRRKADPRRTEMGARTNCRKQTKID